MTRGFLNVWGMAVQAHRRLVQAVSKLRKAESGLADARSELRAAIVEARAAGMTLQAIADELGVTRQRVKVILDEEGVR